MQLLVGLFANDHEYLPLCGEMMGEIDVWWRKTSGFAPFSLRFSPQSPIDFEKHQNLEALTG
jgi:hypothetical protein